VARIPRTTGTTPNTDPNFAQAKAEFMKELKKLPNVTFLTKKQSKAVFDNMEFPHGGCIAIPKTKNSAKKNSAKNKAAKKRKPAKKAKK